MDLSYVRCGKFSAQNKQKFLNISFLIIEFKINLEDCHLQI